MRFGNNNEFGCNDKAAEFSRCQKLHSQTSITERKDGKMTDRSVRHLWRVISRLVIFDTKTVLLHHHIDRKEVKRGRYRFDAL